MRRASDAASSALAGAGATVTVAGADERGASTALLMANRRVRFADPVGLVTTTSLRFSSTRSCRWTWRAKTGAACASLKHASPKPKPMTSPIMATTSLLVLRSSAHGRSPRTTAPTVVENVGVGSWKGGLVRLPGITTVWEQRT